MSFKVTWKTHIKCCILAAAITIFSYPISSSIVLNFLFNDFMIKPTPFIHVNFYLYIFLFMIPITIIHELIHGIAHKAFGGTVRFGFKGIYAYTQEVSGNSISRTKFLIVLMAPLVVISLLSLTLPNWLGGIIFFLNLLGASGDLYMSFNIIRYDWNSKIVDREYGFDVIK